MILKIFLGVSILIAIALYIKKKKFSKGLEQSTRTYTWSKDNSLLINDLRNTFINLEKLEFLIINFGNYYIQYQYLTNDNKVLGEIISDSFIPKEYQYSETQKRQILYFGFLEPDGERIEDSFNPNYHKVYNSTSQDGIEIILQEFIEIIQTVYQLELHVEIKCTS